MPSQGTLVKSVSKKLKYYLDIQRLEEGFDLSGPQCPQTDPPSLKSRPTLLYDGLHDKPVKLFYRQKDVRQKLTHLDGIWHHTAPERKMKRLVRKNLQRYHFRSPWTGPDGKTGASGGRNVSFVTDQSYKQPPSAFSGGKAVLRVAPSPHITRGEAARLVNTASKLLCSSVISGADLSSKMTASRPRSAVEHQSKHGSSRSKARPSTATGSIRIPATTESTPAKSSTTGYNTRSSQRKSTKSQENSSHGLSSRSASEKGSPSHRRNSSAGESLKSSMKEERITKRQTQTPPRLVSQSNRSEKPTKRSESQLDNSTNQPKRIYSSKNQTLTKQELNDEMKHGISYSQAKNVVIKDIKDEDATINFKKGRVRYDMSGKKVPVPSRRKFDNNYLSEDKTDSAYESHPNNEDSPKGPLDKVPDWLKTQMKRHSVDERKIYNSSVREGQPIVAEGRKEDIPARSENAYPKPKSSRKRVSSGKSSDHGSHRGSHHGSHHSGRLQDSSQLSHSRITLSEDGSFEQVPLDQFSSGEEYVEDKGIQTGWELFVQYDQSDFTLSEGELGNYMVTVRTGSTIGASTKAPVMINFIGERGTTKDYLLNQAVNHKVPFQQGNDDVFEVSVFHVGELRKIRIGHDQTDIGDGWFLDSVTVLDQKTSQCYEFLCSDWLSVRSQDKQTRRIISYSARRTAGKDDKALYVHEPVSDGENENKVDEHDSQSRSRSSSESSSESSGQSSIGSDEDASHAATMGTERRRDSDRQEKRVSSSASSSGSSGSSSSEEEGESEAAVMNMKKLGVDLSDDETKSIDRPRPSAHGLALDEQDGDAGNRDFDSTHVESSRGSGSSDDSSESSEPESEYQTAVFENRTVRFADAEVIEEDPKQAADTYMTGFQAGVEAARKSHEDEQKESPVADSRKMTPPHGPNIHGAARDGNLERVKTLVEYDKGLLSKVDDRGSTPLHLACTFGHVNLLKWLCGQEINMEIQDRTGYEPIHLAALHGHVRCLQFIVAMGTDINKLTDDGMTPLHLASMGGHTEACKWLIANRADIAAADDFGRTPVNMAEGSDNTELKEFLETCETEMNEGSVSTHRSSLAYIRSPTAHVTENRRKSSPAKVMTPRSSRTVVEEDDEDEEHLVVSYDRSGDATGYSDEDDETADLRSKEQQQEALEEKKKVFEEMQSKKEEGHSTFLDIIRAEVDGN